MARTIQVTGPAGMAAPTLRLYDMTSGALVEEITLGLVGAPTPGETDNHYIGTMDAVTPTPAGKYKAAILDGGNSLGAVERVEIVDADPSTVYVRDFVNTSAVEDAVYPPECYVAEGFVYGPNGDDFVGCATDLGTIPADTDVREGVAVGGGVGNIHLPPQDKVEEGYLYGANSNELTGTGPPAPGATPGLPPDVIDDKGDMFIVRGDDYDGENMPTPVWNIPADWVGIDAQAKAKWAFRGTPGSAEFDAVLDHNARTVTLILTAEDTARFQSFPSYRYDIQITLGGVGTSTEGKVRTLATGNLAILDTYTDP